MTSLKDLQLKISYGPNDDGLRDFFIPAMVASIRYDRAAGYFSSTMLAVAAAGVTKLIAGGGKMRLLCGADLSEDDVAAIREGHATLEQQVEKHLVTRWVLPESDYVQKRLKALAWLVGTGQLEIKVVLPTGKDGRPLPASMSESYYHPKEGLFTDSDGNQVGFSGSINETAKALEDNYESFVVFNSWETGPYVGNVRVKFEKLWESREHGWVAMPIPEAVKQKLLKLRPATPPMREFGVEDEISASPLLSVSPSDKKHEETGRQGEATGADRFPVSARRSASLERRSCGDRNLCDPPVAASASRG